MRAHYDFATMKGDKNPYIKLLKQPVTIRLDKESVAYFKALATELGIPYQNLINLYLRDCVVSKRRLTWATQTLPNRRPRRAVCPKQADVH